LTTGWSCPPRPPKFLVPAELVFDGLEKGEEDIFPDPMSAAMADGWRLGSQT
jgi:hypothetical protein